MDKDECSVRNPVWADPAFTFKKKLPNKFSVWIIDAIMTIFIIISVLIDAVINIFIIISILFGVIINVSIIMSIPIDAVIHIFIIMSIPLVILSLI